MTFYLVFFPVFEISNIISLLIIFSVNTKLKGEIGSAFTTIINVKNKVNERCSKAILSRRDIGGLDFQ